MGVEGVGVCGRSAGSEVGVAAVIPPFLAGCFLLFLVSFLPFGGGFPPCCGVGGAADPLCDGD